MKLLNKLISDYIKFIKGEDSLINNKQVSYRLYNGVTILAWNLYWSTWYSDLGK